MSNIQQQENHVQQSYQHRFNHVHQSYRCYLRTADMRSKIHTVSTDQSVSQLKQQVKTLLNLENIQSSSIKLVVNEIQLTDEMNLALHLFHNAIIHVLPSKRSQNQRSQQVSIKIKQPPIDCPPVVLGKVGLNQNLRQLKSRIIAFYKFKYLNHQIAELNENQLYLVYGGRILADNKTLSDFDFEQNGIVYVVNGRVYAREVTREEADRRIQQIKNQKSSENISAIAQQQESQNGSQIQKEEADNIVFNIIQNIVHDEDSDVEGETANDLTRSQKFIQRYDSKTEKIFKNQDDVVIDVQEVDQTQYAEQEDQFLHKEAQNQNDKNQNAKTSAQQINELSHEERNTVIQYLNQVNQKIISSQSSLEDSSNNDVAVHQNNRINVSSEQNKDKDDEMLL